MLPVKKSSVLRKLSSLLILLYLLQVTIILADDDIDTKITSTSSRTELDEQQVNPARSTLTSTSSDYSDDEVKVEDESEVDVATAGSPSGAYDKEATSNDDPNYFMGARRTSRLSSSKMDAATAVAKILEFYNSEKTVGNVSTESPQNVSGVSANATKPIKTTVSCLPKQWLLLNDDNTSMVVEPTVEIVNFTKLIQDVLLINTTIKAKTTPANCTIVYFYAHWCKFSAKAAAHVNALARVFPSIRTIAIDCSLHSTVSSHFGVLSVPTMLLFHNGKTIAKFNDTTFTLNKFAEFIQYFTDQKYDEKLLNVTSKDFQGPIPSTPSQERDIWLLLAWIFIIVCFIYYTSRSTLWRRVVDLIRTTWREAEAQHEHID